MKALKTYQEVADRVGLIGRVRDRYIRYMTIRWKREELIQCITGYAEEWAIRFKNRVEFNCSDSIGRIILRNLREREEK